MSGCRGIVIRNGQVLMVRHENDGTGHWCLPGGGMEPGETPEECIVREVREECGIAVEVVRLLTVNHFETNDVQYCFLLRSDDPSPTLGIDPELPANHQVLKDIRFMDPVELDMGDCLFMLTSGGFVEPRIRNRIMEANTASHGTALPRRP